ncbi:MAG: hypothetical protein ACYCZ0_04660 [Minisyncoccota bacterium]
MTNDTPKHESGFEKGMGIGFGIVWAIALVVAGSLLLIMIFERFGPPSAWHRSRQAAVIGTPGSGYVAGAPVNATECIARGGHVVYGGKGCRDYR